MNMLRWQDRAFGSLLVLLAGLTTACTFTYSGVDDDAPAGEAPTATESTANEPPPLVVTTESGVHRVAMTLAPSGPAPERDSAGTLEQVDDVAAVAAIAAESGPFERSVASLSAACGSPQRPVTFVTSAKVESGLDVVSRTLATEGHGTAQLAPASEGSNVTVRIDEAMHPGRLLDRKR